MPLTILAIADQVHPSLYDHFDSERWKDVDLVLSAGDLPTDYLDFLCTTLCVPVFYVRGNHDGKYPVSLYAGCDNLHGRIVEFRGIRFAGFEGSRRYNNGGCQYTERAMSRIARRSQLKSLLRGRPDVVLAHAPPAGCHDGEDVCHRGFECFCRVIRSWRPAYFVHGHTHRHYGRDMVSDVGSTTVVNAFPFYRFQVPDEVPDISPAAQARRKMVASSTRTYPSDSSRTPDLGDLLP